MHNFEFIVKGVEKGHDYLIITYSVKLKAKSEEIARNAIMNYMNKNNIIVQGIEFNPIGENR